MTRYKSLTWTEKLNVLGDEEKAFIYLLNEREREKFIRHVNNDK